MSSETSTSRVLPPTGGSHEPIQNHSRGFRLHAEDQGFHAGHFFVLLSLLAATVAVVLARPSAPENLILISLTIGAAGAAGYGVYLMLAPLVAARLRPGRQVLSDRMRQDLEREKALTLRSIKELEFDRAMGKLSDEDFEEMSGRLRARALGIMKQLDAGSSAYRAMIEKELAARVGKPSKPDLPASAKATAGGQVGRATSQPDVCACGTKNDPDAKFCKNCGAKLRAA
jgi:hypothetical protein